MPQGAIVTSIARNATTQVQLQCGTAGELLTANGKSAALNQTAAAVIKVGAGRLSAVVIVAPGTTSGSFTLNDSATTGGAAAGNLLWTIPFNGTGNAIGARFVIDIPFANGLVISAVPGAGSPIINVIYS